MKKYLSIYALALLLFSGACMVGPKYQKPAIDTAASYGANENADTSSLIKWFDLFKDKALQNIIKTTLNNNKDLLAALSSMEQSKLQTDIIRINQYPSFYYQAAAGGGHAGKDAQKLGAGVEGALFKTAGLLSWELDIWGKLRRSTAAAQAQYLAIQENSNAIKVSLVAQAASLYFLLRDLDNRLLIAQKTLATRKENTRIITLRYDTGYISEVDKYQAIQQEAQAAALIPNIQRQITQTENALSVLMSKNPGPIERGLSIFEQTIMPDIPVGLPSQLLQRRPDLKAAEFRLQSQFQQIGIAQANLYPSFSLTGILGFASPQLSSFLTDGFVANGLGSLTGPIFQFRQNKKRIAVEKLRTQQYTLQYEQNVLTAFGEVNTALVALKTFSDEYEQRRILAEAGRKALVLSTARYDYGYTSYLEVLSQQNTLFDAELQESSLFQQKLNAMVNLYKALGGGWE